MIFRKHKTIAVAAMTVPILAVAIVIAFFLVSESAKGRLADSQGKGGKSGISSMFDFWQTGQSANREEEIAGLDEETMARLPPKEQASYKEYLKRLQKDVIALKFYLEPEKPDFQEIYTKFLPERWEALRQPVEAEVDPELRETAEGRAFLEKRNGEQSNGLRATRLEMLHILMQRYSPRLTESERNKIIREIGREEGHPAVMPVGIKGVYP